uniref:Uncharacterized protein n=1 Tax=Arundo donax TaxID=35708 RepID=A0A0A8XY22_ARUDO
MAERRRRSTGCWSCSRLRPAHHLILSTRFSTEMLDSSVGCKFVTFNPAILSIQLDQLIVKISLWWNLDKIQERLHQLMVLVNRNRRGRS